METELIAECWACEGEGEALGTLGRTVYYRCRECGVTFPMQPMQEKKA